MHLADLIAQQQVAIGLVMATLMGGVLFGLRAIPGKIWLVLREQFSVTLVVEGRDLMYDQLNLWLSRQGAAAKARRVMLQEEYDYDANQWRWRVTLGRGMHLIWAFGRLVVVHREVTEGGELAKLLGAGANQRLWLITLGRDQGVIRRLIQEAEAIYKNDGLVRIYVWSEGSYHLADRRTPRALDTVFMPAAQKRRILADVEGFLEGRDTYRKRGTPYRRGYLFEGAPGTGKTSLIFAIAGQLKKAVYVVNLNQVAGDNALLAAFNAVGNDGVIAIEDIDTAEITRDRDLVAVERATAPGVKAPETSPSKITLSGLLNAIDGVAAREGRLLFVTTNHAEALDPALLRPGRMDVREIIGKLDAGAAREMFEAYRPDAPIGEFERLVAPRLPLAAADLQGLLQEPPGDVVELYEEAA